MKKRNIIICIILLCILVFVVVGFIIYRNINIDNVVSFEISNINSEVYSVVTNTDIKHFNNKYQEAVDTKINKLMDKKYSFEHPFMILNPYDTNTTAINIYFSEKGEIEYTVSIDDEKIPDYTNNLKQYKIGNNYGSSIIGLVAGYKNNIKLTLTSENGKVEEKEILVDLTNLKYEGEIAKILNISR